MTDTLRTVLVTVTLLEFGNYLGCTKPPVSVRIYAFSH